VHPPLTFVVDAWWWWWGVRGGLQIMRHMCTTRPEMVSTVLIKEYLIGTAPAPLPSPFPFPFPSWGGGLESPRLLCPVHPTQRAMATTPTHPVLLLCPVIIIQGRPTSR
jgi:hypothetical protein